MQKLVAESYVVNFKKSCPPSRCGISNAQSPIWKISNRQDGISRMNVRPADAASSKHLKQFACQPIYTFTITMAKVTHLRRLSLAIYPLNGTAKHRSLFSSCFSAPPHSTFVIIRKTKAAFCIPFTIGGSPTRPCNRPASDHLPRGTGIRGLCGIRHRNINC